MNEVKRHHYIPQFYLSQWHKRDGKVVCYKHVNRRLIVNDVSPRGTGYEKYLHSLDRVPVIFRDRFEKDVTAPVDNDAAEALQTMTKGGAKALISEQRLAWERFLASLPIRNP
jgi:Protein of unknown function (DUF4238)